MTKFDTQTLAHMAALLNRAAPRLDPEDLQSYVSRYIDRRDEFLQIAQNEGTPAYIFDPAMVRTRADQFRAAFADIVPAFQPHFAVKSNNYPGMMRLLGSCGFGLDVSSGEELTKALASGATHILFSGPGKTEAELELAVQNHNRVTLLVDSVAELDKLNRLSCRYENTMRVGVRLTTDENGIWRKFGIPLSQLQDFIVRAERFLFVSFEGIQFHLSWNLTPEKYVLFIASLGATLRGLSRAQRQTIRFVDIGGGFWPSIGEWLQPAATPAGQLRQLLSHEPGKVTDHHRMTASSIDEFALHIGTALKNLLPGDMAYSVYAEPGRWICNEAMHMLLRVEDRKMADLVITDGGTNAIGWDRYESDFCPIINLSQPAVTENECLVAGSLCTPHDLWGYSYFGEGIQEGDILLVPDQGAYTYSLRQNFIKSPPPVYALEDSPAPVTA